MKDKMTSVVEKPTTEFNIPMYILYIKDGKNDK